MLNYFKKISARKWLLGTRRDESILFYSMKAAGEKKYLPTLGLHYVERLLVPATTSGSIRALEESQANALHAEVRQRVLKNPQILPTIIERDRLVLKKLVRTSIVLKNRYPKNTPAQNLKLFSQACALYAQHSAWVYFCFAGGVQLTKNLGRVKNLPAAKKALAAHDRWRNFITFPEEKFGENIFPYLRVALSALKIVPARDYNYLSITELHAYLKSHHDPGLLQKIKARKRGQVYLELAGDTQIITDHDFIKKTKDWLSQTATPPGNQLVGQTAFGQGKIIGRVARIMDVKKLTKNLKGKVVLAVQTTPHFLPYLHGVKAIITDEGGITCHAAIIARERKIPCIVGTKRSTKILKNNDLVELDLDSGTVCKNPDPAKRKTK